MKKYIAILIVLLTFVNLIPVSANEMAFLNTIGIEMTKESTAQITRDEFIYMASHLISRENKSPVDTSFSDVDSTNEYSGYVEYLLSLNIISGNGDNLFMPKEKVNISMAYKILVNILGCGGAAEQMGGYPKGYEIVAQELKIGKKVSNSEFLTFNDAVQLIYNTLTLEIDELDVAVQDDRYILRTPYDNKSILLCDQLEISVYTGLIKKVSASDKAVEFCVNKNKFEQNPVCYKNGETVELDVAPNIDIANFIGAPVTIWVHNEKIINIDVNKGVEIKTGYIDSVNGDRDDDSWYPASRIEYISITDDETEYSLNDSATIKTDEFTANAPVCLVGKYARFVVENDEITFMETWTMTDGGIITDITEEQIEYIKGDEGPKRINGFAEFKSKRIFIDGVSSDEKDLRIDTVFSYFSNNDTMILVDSEKVVTDTFHTVMDDCLEIGGFLYSKKEVYTSVNGTDYKHSGTFNDFLNSEVTAYISPDGNVKYLKYAKNSEITAAKEIYGIVNSVEEDRFEETAQVEIWVTDPEIKKVVYNITNKTKFNDEITINELGVNAKNTNGEGVYVFTVTSQGNVSKISRPEPFYGFENNAKADISSFLNLSKPTVSINGIYLCFDAATPIITLYKENGEFVVKSTLWQDLRGKKTNGAKISFYGKDKSSDPSFIVLGGELDIIGASTRPSFGMIKSTSIVIDGNGDEWIKFNVVENSQTVEYLMDKKTGSAYKNNEFISYYKNLLFSDNEFHITSHTDLNGDYDNWQVKTAKNAEGLHKGVIDAIDGKRVILEDGYTYFYYDEVNFFSATQNSKYKFSVCDFRDMNRGDTIFFYLYGGQIVSMIDVTN